MGYSPLMRPMTVVETSLFIRFAEGLLTADERERLIDYIARNPEAGDLIKDTGGARKVRWARGASGKSGGVRSIYYYHDQDVPLFLLTIYGKGDKANLSAADKAAIHRVIDGIKARVRDQRLAPAGE